MNCKVLTIKLLILKTPCNGLKLLIFVFIMIDLLIYNLTIQNYLLLFYCFYQFILLRFLNLKRMIFLLLFLDLVLSWLEMKYIYLEVLICMGITKKGSKMCIMFIYHCKTNGSKNQICHLLFVAIKRLIIKVKLLLLEVLKNFRIRPKECI